MLSSRAVAGNVRRAAFFNLPSHLRLSAHQQSSARFFSASPSRKINAVEVIAAPPLAVLSGLHAVGIPWYAAIPTAAILIRGVFVYYLSTVPSRRRQQIRANLQPLIEPALRIRLQDIVAKKEATTRRALDIIMARLKINHDAGKEFGAGLISWTSPLNFVALIATTEAVRMKCGAHSGLLSILTTPINWLGRQIAPEYFPAAIDPVDKVAQEMVDKLEQIRARRLQEAQEQGVNSELNSDVSLESISYEPAAPPAVSPELSWFDPTLQTEGIAWFTNLSQADPLGYLPWMTASVMIATIALNPLSKPRQIPASWHRVTKSIPSFVKFSLLRYSPLQHLGMSIACLFGFALQNMPAGVVLYLFTSMLVNTLQRKWLDFKMPLHPGIKPCVRPTRVRSKKQWSARQ
ncbi:hypothetical protein Q7P37_009038 [Cladosporium fusiforme]